MLKTNYNQDYIKYNVKPERVNKNSEYIKTDIPFNNNSEYNNNYKKHDTN